MVRWVFDFEKYILLSGCKILDRPFQNHLRCHFWLTCDLHLSKTDANLFGTQYGIGRVLTKEPLLKAPSGLPINPTNPPIPGVAEHRIAKSPTPK